jgi:Lon protease-like protein
MLAMVASRQPEKEDPGPDDLYDVGVTGTVARMIKVPDGTLRILVQGGPRVRLTGFVGTEPYLVARIEELPDVVDDTPEVEALARNVQTTFSEIVQQVPYLPEELQIAVANVDDPVELSWMIAGAAGQDRGEAGAPVRAPPDQAAAPALGAPGPRVRADLDRLADPVAGPVGDGEGTARVLPAAAAEGDPGRAR